MLELPIFLIRMLCNETWKITRLKACVWLLGFIPEECSYLAVQFLTRLTWLLHTRNTFLELLGLLIRCLTRLYSKRCCKRWWYLQWSRPWLVTAAGWGSIWVIREGRQRAGWEAPSPRYAQHLPPQFLLTYFWIYPWPLKILQITAFPFTGTIASKNYALEFNFKIFFPLLWATDILIDCFSFITLF